MGRSKALGEASIGRLLIRAAKSVEENRSPRRSGPVGGAEVLKQDLRGFGVLAGRAGLRKSRLQAIERRRGLAGQFDVAHRRAWRRTLACIRERDQVILLVKDSGTRD